MQHVLDVPGIRERAAPAVMCGIAPRASAKTSSCADLRFAAAASTAATPSASAMSLTPAVASLIAESAQASCRMCRAISSASCAATAETGAEIALLSARYLASRTAAWNGAIR
jgi:hypothetical protein